LESVVVVVAVVVDLDESLPPSDGDAVPPRPKPPVDFVDEELFNGVNDVVPFKLGTVREVPNLSVAVDDSVPFAAVAVAVADVASEDTVGVDDNADVVRAAGLVGVSVFVSFKLVPVVVRDGLKSNFAGVVVKVVFAAFVLRFKILEPDGFKLDNKFGAAAVVVAAVFKVFFNLESGCVDELFNDVLLPKLKLDPSGLDAAVERFKPVLLAGVVVVVDVAAAAAPLKLLFEEKLKPPKPVEAGFDAVVAAVTVEAAVLAPNPKPVNVG
jgi:hypothetical protein